MSHQITTFLKESETFEEFYINAEDILWEHFKELHSQDQIF